MRARANRAPILNRDREAASPDAVRVFCDPAASARYDDRFLRKKIEQAQRAWVAAIHRLASVPIMF